MIALWALLAVTALRLLVAALVPLAPDEAYYWVWSRALQPGYLDHPPMVALFIRAGTLLAGEGAFGISSARANNFYVRFNNYVTIVCVLIHYAAVMVKRSRNAVSYRFSTSKFATCSNAF
jgi:hypothetical protein